MAEYAFEGPKWASNTITWSFATTNYAEDPLAPFSVQIAGAAQTLVEQAFARWQSVANVNFVQVADSDSADIRLGFGDLSTDTSDIIGQTRWHDAGTDFSPDTIIRFEDPTLVRLAYDLSNNLAYFPYDITLYQVALHEIGHAMGLAHSSDIYSVMYPVAQSSDRGVTQADIVGIQSLYGAPGSTPAAPQGSTSVVGFADTTTGASSTQFLTGYSGPLTYLQFQYIYVDSDNVNITTTTANVFLRSGSGTDALLVTSGQNVLDGGLGSNFLTGGSGTDTFFVDGREGGVTWSTLNNFHAGDSVTLWGWQGGVSQSTWADNQGAGGFTGATLHADLTNSGTINDSMTFSGYTVAQAKQFTEVTGNVQGNSYLQITA